MHSAHSAKRQQMEKERRTCRRKKDNQEKLTAFTGTSAAEISDLQTKPVTCCNNEVAQKSATNARHRSKLRWPPSSITLRCSHRVSRMFDTPSNPTPGTGGDPNTQPPPSAKPHEVVAVSAENGKNRRNVSTKWWAPGARLFFGKGWITARFFFGHKRRNGHAQEGPISRAKLC